MGETCSQRQDRLRLSRQVAPSSRLPQYELARVIADADDSAMRSMGARELQVDVESVVHLGARLESCQIPTFVC